jgi:hypothetical protein
MFDGFLDNPPAKKRGLKMNQNTENKNFKIFYARMPVWICFHTGLANPSQ